MRALLLSNMNMRPLEHFFGPGEITCREPGSLLGDLTVEDSPAASRDFRELICIFDSDGMAGEAFYGQGPPSQSEAFLGAVDSFSRRHPEKPLVLNTFCLSSARWLNFADLLDPASLAAMEIRLNERLVSMARCYPNLILIDFGALFRRYGEQTLTSPSFWYAGRIRYTNQMFRVLARTIEQALAAWAGRSRKVLILDLDNTLWGGLAGELGPLGIALSEDGIGRCYRDFQRLLKAAQTTGLLLAVCSKNNRADIEEIFARNPMMVLRREDFASVRINWHAKPDNIVEIAQELNLGLESFVFLDDQAAEREMVRAALPDVAVPDFPQHVEKLPGWFAAEILPAYFGKFAITREDREKAKQYRAIERRSSLSRGLTAEQFLEVLEIRCTVHVDSAERVMRAAQMTQKTNQFNLTSRRYSRPDIDRFVKSSDHRVILLDYQDRFGSEGSVGLAILDLLNCSIDTFLLSCRIIGRKIEDRLLDAVLRVFREQGIDAITGEFLPTAKNLLVQDFYETHGFTLRRKFEDGRKLYERTLARVSEDCCRGEFSRAGS
jgi:FkbH-like protein